MKFERQVFNVIIFIGYVFLFSKFCGRGLGMGGGLFFTNKCKNLYFNYMVYFY